MKSTSPLFDRIRVKPNQDRTAQTGGPACDWPGCNGHATHRAPKGRVREGEYWRFCLDHVREYNHSYNYFAGMSDDAVMQFQKDALTGHRPTWRMGVKGSRGAGPEVDGVRGGYDPFGMFSELGGGRADRPERKEAQPEGRVLRNAERKALDVLGLEANANAAEIKARYKTLVKRHHPDANGGDRACEDQLRAIIQAYNYLKSCGFG